MQSMVTSSVLPLGVLHVIPQIFIGQPSTEVHAPVSFAA